MSAHKVGRVLDRLLARVRNPRARGFYGGESANANWSTGELERQISTLPLNDTRFRGRKRERHLTVVRQRMD